MPKKTNEVQDRIKLRAALYGNKAANLIELDDLCSKIKNKKINIKIPEIFPIDDESIQQHLDKYAKKWRQLWEKYLTLQSNHKTLTDEGMAALKSLRDLITECFHNYPFSPEVIKNSNLSEDTLFMVRSSGDEDRVEIANPGGNKSVAAVKLDKSSISNAIGTVVASYFSEKSLTQRLLSGDDIHQAFMPVLIQKMIGEKLNGFDNPQQRVISGVMYAKRDGITRLDAAFGHGEIIVNSKAPFDTFEVTNDDIVHAAIHHKKARLVPTEVKDENNQTARKLIFKENPKKLQKISSVTPEIALEIAHVGRQIASHYNMPMDIEWVFTPETQTLSIVQARPIPQSLKRKIIPSTISPDQWKKLKNDPDVQLSKTPVISPAGNEAKIVKSETTILAGNIASALNSYLKKSEQKHIDAVVVKEPAPSTSHEAAQFNLMGVPVYQGPIEAIDRWLKEEKSVVIADTQHQHFVNMTNINKRRKIDDEKTLRDEKTIVDGMYTSSLSTSKTLLPGLMVHDKVIKAKIYDYLLNNQGMGKVNGYVKAKKIHSTLLDCIETIESAKINDRNSEAFAALQTIADIFKAIGTSSKSHDKTEPHQKLFVHALCSIAEIDHCLSDFSQLTKEDDKQKIKQQELLDLVSKLKAIVINPGELNLYSDSIYQLAMQTKTLQESKINTPELNHSQQSYFIEFLKLKALALNEDTQRIWEDFAYECARTPVARQMLSQMIMFAVENNMLSELANNLFMNAVKNNTKNETVIAKLYELFDENRNEFKQYHINENNQLLLAWENRINDWSNPNKFEKLFKEFNLELYPLISSLTLDDKMSNLTRQIILKQVERLTEVIDKSIKAMKSSMEYQGQEGLLVERFAKLLTPYHELMRIWMKALPTTFYDECAAKIRKDMSYNDKLVMLSAIYTCFSNATSKSNLNPSQLNASSFLNVASAKVGSNASFERQFVQQHDHFTLEDYFSLFHQNILASIAELNKKSIPSDADLPKIIQPFITEIKQAKNAHLLHVTHRHPIIELEFNIPLDNHSAKFILEFNTKTKSLVINGKFFGMNWNNRMFLIGRIAEMEGLLAGEVLQQPVYHEDSRSLEFSWQINADRIPYLANHIKEIVNHYAAMTESSFSNLSANYSKLWERHCVNSSIPLDVLKCLSLENRQTICENILTINSGLLDETILKNPELFPFFANKMNELINSADLSTLNFASLEKLIDQYGPKLEFTRTRGGETLLERLISAWPSEDSLKFLLKYQPDLTLHSSLINRAIKAKCDAKLFEYILSHGAPFDFYDMKSALETPDISRFVIKAMEKWDAAKLSSWIYSNAYKAEYDSSNRLCILKIIEQFSDKIDFTYKHQGANYPLFEHLATYYFFAGMTENQFNEFLVKHKIDISKKPDLLNILLKSNSRHLYLFLLKQSIAEHVLDPRDLENLRDVEIAPLLAPWSAAELKSWIDNHAGKIYTSTLRKMTHLYLSKYIHALNQSFPEEIRLNLISVLVCFNNNPEPQLIDLFKQWNGDERISWLIDSMSSISAESFPALLKFIELTHTNINQNIWAVSGITLNLFELIVPFLNDKMAKKDIEKFLNDHNFDIAQNPKAFTKCVSSIDHSQLADILVDKGANFLDFACDSFSEATYNKKMQPVLLKAFVKLTSEVRTRFLSSYRGEMSFYSDLIESSLKDLNFQYKNLNDDTLFETSIKYLDDKKLVNMVRNGLIDLSKNQKALLNAVRNIKSDLTQVILEEKAGNHTLTGEDVAVLDALYPKSKLSSIFKNWNQQQFSQWLAIYSSDIPQYFKQVITELYQSMYPNAATMVIPDSLENMLKYCFKDTVLADRIQHIKINTLIDLETFIEFTDSDVPLNKEQKDCIKQFFKQFDLEDWKIKSEDTFRFQCAGSMMGHGPQMDLFISENKLTKLLKTHISKEQLNKSKSPFHLWSIFKSNKPTDVPVPNTNSISRRAN